MRIDFLPITIKKLAQRGISRDQVIEVVMHPEQVVPGYGGRTVYQSRIRLPERAEQLLRVVCEEDLQKNKTVITAYAVSDIQRYWRA